MSIRYLIALLAIFTLGACAGSDSADVPDPETPPEDQNYQCRPPHTPPSGMTQIHTFESCDEKTQQSVDTGQFVGKPLTNGALTVTFTGFGDVSPPSAALFFLFEAHAPGGQAINMHAFFKGANPRYSRLVHHYWSAIPAGLQAPHSSQNITLNSTEIYTWDCTWDENRFVCNLLNGDGATQTTYDVGLIAPFHSFRGFGVLFGNRVYRPQSSGVNARATSLRLTVFQ